MNNPVIEIERAVLAYRGTTALRDVSLQVKAGEFVGIIGPNGAGKTTLLTVINGLRRLTQGQVRVLGKEPHRFDAFRLRRRIGYVAQAPQIDARLPITARETVMVGAYGRTGRGLLRSRRLEEEAAQALTMVGMPHLADRPLGHLSGGEFQRVSIARALMQRPDIFLFDEPTASIDPQAQQDILEIIQHIHAHCGGTALYVTHDLATLPAACQRLVLMKDGTVWREGPRHAMLDTRLLKALYNGAERPARAASA